MTGKEFTCSTCYRTFTDTRPEEETRAEAKELWDIDDPSGPDVRVVCGDCFVLISQHITEIASSASSEG